MYKQFLIYRLNDIFVNGYIQKAYRSPVDCMFEALQLYKLEDRLKNCIQTGFVGNMVEWKKSS